MTKTIGFLGTGHLASYTIAALRNGGHAGDIILSPRNAAVAERLSRDHVCEVMNSNQDVVDRAGIVVLSVRPQQLAALVEGLRFPDDQIVLSAVAATRLDDLKAYSNLPQTIVRFMPSSFIEAGDAIFPLFPKNEVLEELLGALGSVVTFDTEAQFELAMIASCAYAWVYDIADELTEWFTSAGWPADLARDMALRHIRGATTYALANPSSSLADISAGIATEGTFTKLGLEHLRSAGAISVWSDALDLLRSKLENR
ncbi:MAG: NAD(P)-binding domain-containing protein [Rhizobiaceae bacterium]